MMIYFAVPAGVGGKQAIRSVYAEGFDVRQVSK